jgi:hypothetical protein
VHVGVLRCGLALLPRQHLAVAYAQRLDPTLLAAREGDEEAEFDQLRLAEMRVQLLPERIVGDPRVPDDGARVGERGLLAFGEAIRVLEMQELFVLLLGDGLLSRPDRSLDASILALDGFGHVDPAELFEGVVANPVAESQLPCLRERPDDCRHMRSDGLALGTRRPMEPGVFKVTLDLRVGHRRRVDVTDACHRSQSTSS